MSAFAVLCDVLFDQFAGVRDLAAQRKNRRRNVAMRAAWAAVGVVCLMAASAAHALPAVQYSGYESNIWSSGTPAGVVVDSSGDVIISDSTQVVELTWNGSGYNAPYPLNITPIGSLQGLALDSSNNLYVADNGGQIWVGSAPYTSAFTGLLTGSPTCLGVSCVPANLVFDPQGAGSILFTSNTGSDPNVYTIPLTGATGAVPTIGVTTNLTQAYGLALQTSASPVLFISDAATSAIVETTYSLGTWGSPATSVATSVLTNGVQSAGLAANSTGTLYIAAPGNTQAFDGVWNGASFTSQSAVPSSILSSPSAIALDSNGNIYIAEAGNVLKESTSAFNFGTETLGTPSSAITLLFTFNSTATLAGTPTAILTQGQPGLDFADAGGSTCTSGSHLSGTTCTVNVKFTPSVAGARRGAVQLIVGASPAATAYVYGTGQGPQISFSPGTLNSLVFGVLDSPSGVALDGAGNLYMADSTNGIVWELPFGSPIPTAYVTHLTDPQGIALDAAGNLFVAETSAGKVLELPPGCTNATNVCAVSIGSFTNPFGVAVDGSGNLYVSDDHSDVVSELSWTNPGYGAPVALTGIVLSNPGMLALDAAGDLFVANAGGHSIVEAIWSGTAFNPLAPVVSSATPVGVAVDPWGNLYIGDPTSGSLLEALWNGVSYGSAAAMPGATGLIHPQGVALDGLGNVYVADSGAPNVYELVQATGPSLTFASEVAYGGDSVPQTVTVSNDGNDGINGLTVTAASVAPGFVWDTSSGCVNPLLIPFDVTAGTSCTAKVDFDPTMIGANSGTVNFTDNSPGSPQSIELAGTATPYIIVVSAPVQADGGTPFSISVTVEDPNNADAIVTGYSGTVTFSGGGVGATLPVPYTFIPGTDNGTHTFTNGVTLVTGGNQTITATDGPPNSIHGTSGNILVIPSNALFTASAGSPQWALVNDQFPVPLTVTLTTVGLAPLNGVLVNFAAPGSPASASLSAASCVTAGNGSCSVTATANATAGSYLVTATIPGTLLSTTFSLNNVPTAVDPFSVLVPPFYVGTAYTAEPVTVVFTNPGTIEYIDVLTLGVPSLDFAASAPGTTCSVGTSYSAGQSCIQYITFTPEYAGERFGAVVLVGTNGSVLGTEYLDPIAEGPQIAYEVSPTGGWAGLDSTLAVIGANPILPVALAVDGAGDVFVSDANNQQVVEETRQNNGYTQTSVVASNFTTGVQGIAIDGADNVYIADEGGQQLYKVTWNGVIYGAPQALLTPGQYSPNGVAVDEYGNVYFTNSPLPANPNDVRHVYEILASQEVTDSSTVNQIVFGVPQQAYGLAFDSAGNLFVSDVLGNQIYRIPWNGVAYTGIFSTGLAGLTGPAGIALDAAETIYIANSKNPGASDVVKALYNGTSWVTPIPELAANSLTPNTLSFPEGVALDQAGNIYVADTGNNRVIKDDRADAPSLTFDTTEEGGTSADSPQLVTVDNIGNQTLNFSSVAFPTDFPTNPISPLTTCPNSGSLNSTFPNDSCSLEIDFVPTQSGNPTNYNENLTLTDNNLEGINVQQLIHLTGQSYPYLYLRPTSVNFSNQPQGSTGNPWTMTLENEGNAEITGIDLDIINVLGTDDDTSSPLTIPSPETVFTILSNTCGWAPGPNWPASTAGDTKFTLGSYQDCTIQVVFTPLVTGDNADSYTGLLQAKDSSGAIESSTLSGTGSGLPVFLSPNSINFGNQTAGSTSNPWTVTVNNTSPTSVTITGITITGLYASDFGYTTNCGGTVAPFSNCELFVTFNPLATSPIGTPLNATLNVATLIGSTPATLSLSLTGEAIGLSISLAPNNLNFGSQAQGTQSSDQIANLNNNGNGVIDISSFLITAGSSSYKIDPALTTCGTSLPAHGACNIAVYFFPSNSTSGLVNGTLTVVDGAGTQTTSLVGIATSGSSSIVFTPSTVNFGSQTVGSSSSPWTVTLNNTGNSPVTVAYLAPTGNTLDFATVPSGYPAACTTTLAGDSSCSFEVIFTPTAVGARSATYSLTYPGCSGTCTTSLTLTGTGTAPTATLSPNSLNFGTVADNTSSADQLLTLTNTSAGPVTLTSISVLAPFVVDGGSCVVSNTYPGGGSCTISVKFSPTSAGNYSSNATVVLNYTGGSITLTSGLSGIGAAPAVSLTTTSLAFGNVTVGSQSTLALSVTNSGGASIPINGLPFITGSGMFLPVTSGANKGTCGTTITTLAASGSPTDTCTIVVSYTPNGVGAAPASTVSLSFTAGPTLVANLSGNGVAPSVLITPDPVNFGNVTIGTTSSALTATVTNNSNVTVNITGGITPPLTAPFTVGAGTCTNATSLLPGGTCTIIYTFSPTTVGNQTQVVTLSLAAVWPGAPPAAANYNIPPIAATFTGNGVLASATLSPSSLNFGDVFVGLSSAQQVTVTNTSGTALTVGSISVSGPFTVSSNCNTQQLSANGGQCTFSVTFSPNASGNLNGTLTVPLNCTVGSCPFTITAPLFGQGDAPSMSVSPSSINFGNVVYQTGPTVPQLVTIMNTATGPITISSIVINPQLVGDGFQITSNTCPATLNPGVSCNVYVEFNPQVVANYSAQLIIADNAIGSPQIVTLNGAGINKITPNISVSCTPNPLNWQAGSAQTGTCTAYLSGNGIGDTVTFSERVHGNGSFTAMNTGNVSGGTASAVVFSGLAPGTFDIEATFNPGIHDGTYTTASATTSETIVPITPTVTVSCTPGSIPFDTTSTCTATVSNGATGTVNFYWQPQSASSFTFLTSGTLPSATTGPQFAGAPFTAGSYTVEAVYAGATGYAPGETATTSLTITQITPVVAELPTPASPGVTVGVPVGSVAFDVYDNPASSGGCVSAPGYTCPTPVLHGLPGTWVWTNPTDVYGATGSENESVTFIPTDSVDYTTVTGTISFNVALSNMLIGTASYNLIASPASLTLNAGQSGNVALTMIPSAGYTGQLALSCPDLPAGVTCSFAPSTLTADGHGTVQTSTLTISTVGLTASSTPGDQRDGKALAGILILPGLLCGGFLAWRRKKLSGWTKQLLVIAILASTLGGFMGCSGATFNNTLAGTRTITVAAQATAPGSGSSTLSGHLTLTINQ